MQSTMKHSIRSAVLAAAILLPLLSVQAQRSTGTRKAEPKVLTSGQVFGHLDSLLEKRSFRSLEKEAVSAYGTFARQKDTVGMLRALRYRVEALNGYQEGTADTALRIYRRELRGAGPLANSMLQLWTAETYAEYYRRNRWKLTENEYIPGDTSTDLETWSPRRFAEEMLAHFRAALYTDADYLQRLPRAAAGSLVSAPSEKDAYAQLRPFFWEVLAYRVLEDLSEFPVDYVKSTDAFLLDKPGYFAPLEDFCRMELYGGDSLNFHYQALLLAQQLGRMALDEDADCQWEVDFFRWDLLRDYGVMSAAESDTLYARALKQGIASRRPSPYMAEAYYRLALLAADRNPRWQHEPLPDTDRNSLRQAVACCDTAIRLYPESYGGQMAFNLRNRIVRDGSLSAGMPEQAFCPGCPLLLQLSYRNLEHLYYRIIPITADEAWKDRWPDKSGYARGKCLRTGDFTFANPGDYACHSTEKLLDSLPEGYYRFGFSDKEDFSGKVAGFVFEISRLAVVQRRAETVAELQCLDRLSGQALAGVSVKAGNAIQTYHSGADGIARIPAAQIRNLAWSSRLQFRRGDVLHEERCNVHFSDYIYSKYRRCLYYTDRAIYRPGQTVHFKVLACADSAGYLSVLPEHSLCVKFSDAHGRILDSLPLKTNRFGSASGSFAIPADGDCQQYYLYTDNRYSGKGIRVEEYKRPKFEVLFPGAEQSFRLNDSVQIPVQLKSYAGIPLEGCRLRYTVERRTRMPYRWWWKPSPSGTLRITADSCLSDAEGLARISFLALADTASPLPGGGYYEFVLKVTATDANGETHAAETSVRVGRNPYQVMCGAEEMLPAKPGLSVPLKVCNLSGQLQSVKLRARLSRMQQPERCLHERREYPEFPMDSLTFVRAFPDLSYRRPLPMTAWADEAVLYETELRTSREAPVELRLPGNIRPEVGAYRLLLEITDSLGFTQTDTQYFHLYAPEGGKALKTSALQLWTGERQLHSGEKLHCHVGTPFRDACVWVRVVNDARSRLYRFPLSGQSVAFEIPTEKTDKGELTVYAYLLKDGRYYSEQADIPLTDADFGLQIASLDTVFLPGEKAKGVLRCTLDGRPADAEVLLSFYDASLDVFARPSWQTLPPYLVLDVLPSMNSGMSASDRLWKDSPSVEYREKTPSALLDFPFAYGMKSMRFVTGRNTSALKCVVCLEADCEEAYSENAADEDGIVAETEVVEDEDAAEPPYVRTDFRELVCFCPQLQTDAEGRTCFEFEMPENYSRWKLMALAHTPDLRFAVAEKQAVTRNPLMLTPNVPRFYREGDTALFAARIDYSGETSCDAEVRLEWRHADGSPADVLLEAAEKTLTLTPGGSASVSYRLRFTEAEPLDYTLSVRTATASDAESATVPVLSNRQLVQESLPMYINGPGEKTYAMKKLLHPEAGAEPYLLKAEFSSQPVWYAIAALPSLMEYENDDVFSLFLAYYANSFSAHLLQSHPRIAEVLSRWEKDSAGVLMGNLERNPELKQVVLSETPWLLDGRDETENRFRLAQLLDVRRTTREAAKLLHRLKRLQRADGGFSWWPGGKSSVYITQFLLSGIGRGKEAGFMPWNSEMQNLARAAVRFVDGRVVKDYEEALKYKVPVSLDAQVSQYLWARSFFLKDFPLDAKTGKVFRTYLDLAEKEGVEFRSLYLQSALAIALERNGRHGPALQLVQAMKERSLDSEEMGMYWRENAGGYSWSDGYIETQSMLIAAFSEVAGDSLSVRGMQTWLLKQKQTRCWHTSTATADAVYALLYGNRELLEQTAVVEVKVGGETLDASDAEAGTGYVSRSWSGRDIRPEMGQVALRKTDRGPAWGGLHCQYFQDMEKVTASEPRGLRVERQLYVVRQTDRGEQLEPLGRRGQVKVGDRLRVRLTLHSDRSMDFVDLKDLRASGMEPAETLSRYHWDRDVVYYQVVKDASVHFFIEVLPKGTQVFEYDLFVTASGSYSAGAASVQCLYAPEFTAHSQGLRIKVEQ